ncbi:universal stress protein [Dactylosporangium roseum]|uniref:Universal stress protein n=1 Tax=Dactylosporangium roseum TaxID=47989 RepID=A0ABY5YX98_9ACTN|nr:universal stress protein [Dactylosporangium roseum]UWZ34373.1 universal stress protein [Dactylosporangium roseum]
MTIIVGYVPSPEGRAALRHGIAEATLRGETILVINASRGDAYADPRFALTEELDRVRAELAGTGVPFEVRQVVRGLDSAEEVIKAAEATGAPLIVIGLRHRTPVGKLIMGSTAQQILLDAPCPVLAVKADPADA